MSWITENITNFIADLVGGVIEFLGDIINNIFFTIVQYAVTSPYGINAQKVMVSMGFALLALNVVKIVTSGYLLETDYDSDAEPFDLVVRIAETTAVISCSGWIFDYVLQLSKDFASDLIDSTGVTGYSQQTKALLDPSIVYSGVMSLTVSTYVIFICLILIAVIVFTIVSGLRGGELIAMKLFLPIFAIDLLSTSRERWNNFFMGYMLAFFTYEIQILFYTIALKNYMTASLTSPVYFIATAVWMILAIRAPRFLEKYLYKSGVSTAASSGLRMMLQTAALKAV